MWAGNGGLAVGVGVGWGYSSKGKLGHIDEIPDHAI